MSDKALRLFAPELAPAWRQAFVAQGIELSDQPHVFAKIYKKGQHHQLECYDTKVSIHAQSEMHSMVASLATIIRHAWHLQQARQKNQRFQHERSMLSALSMAITASNHLDDLLPRILRLVMDMTQADAASIYLLHESDDVQGTYLQFKAALNDSVALPKNMNKLCFQLNQQSLVGKCAVLAKAMRVELNDNKAEHDTRVDQLLAYESRSVLMIPIKNHENTVLGVLQLLNRKKQAKIKLRSLQDFDALVCPFSQEDEVSASILAGQAAAAIEKTQLCDQIDTMFEHFVLASVHAIEQRDPTTSGHSERVASLTLSLAHAADREHHIDFQLNASRERMLRYACLLHDFGKIGVREDVLSKAKKISPERMNTLLQRLDYMQALMQKDGQNDRIVHDWRQQLLACNEPSILDQNVSSYIALLKAARYSDTQGQTIHLLERHDLHNLSILRGSLNEEERQEINAHVSKTIQFLNMIPWPKNLADLSKIAGAHHEKLDGSGYPCGLSADAIPLETRMMTICDIYDALTAIDRPYKKAMTHTRALDILSFEAKAGKLDASLLQVFIQSSQS